MNPETEAETTPLVNHIIIAVQADAGIASEVMLEAGDSSAMTTPGPEPSGSSSQIETPEIETAKDEPPVKKRKIGEQEAEGTLTAADDAAANGLAPEASVAIPRCAVNVSSNPLSSSPAASSPENTAKSNAPNPNTATPPRRGGKGARGKRAPRTPTTPSRTSARVENQKTGTTLPDLADPTIKVGREAGAFIGQFLAAEQEEKLVKGLVEVRKQFEKAAKEAREATYLDEDSGNGGEGATGA
ncbi:hypothetical protein HDU93_007508 [Gonapodya sp. JEL0774]|nr:hypothetical protein HDU93_007508 [Gonapodya sp. JEL0774]